MTTPATWPITLDAAGVFTPGLGTDPLATNDHDLVHTNLEVVTLGLEAKVGATASTVAASHDYKIRNLETAKANRNHVTNGSMTAWQRGNGPFTANGYTADRWALTNGAGATNSVSRNTLAPGSLGNSGWSIAWNRTVAGSGLSYIQQAIEGVHRLANRVVTLSFYAVGSTTISMDVGFNQFFGTGGSPSTTVAVATQAVAVTAAITRYTYQFTLPSISGKTLGSNGNDYLGVNFQRPSGYANGIVYVWDVQVEEGAVASPFEFEEYQELIAKCQRFYQRFLGSDRLGIMVAISTTQASGLLTMYRQMRATPTLTVGTVSDFSLNNAAAITTTAIVADAAVSAYSYSVLCTVAAGLTSGAAYWLKGAVSYMELSAEL